MDEPLSAEEHDALLDFTQEELLEEVACWDGRLDNESQWELGHACWLLWLWARREGDAVDAFYWWLKLEEAKSRYRQLEQEGRVRTTDVPAGQPCPQLRKDRP